MELLFWAAGATVLLGGLAVAAGRRRRGAGAPPLPPSPGAPAHGAGSDVNRMFGGPA